MRLYFLISWIGLYVLTHGVTLAQAQEAPAHAVEIIADGKRYESVHTYKHEQIKNILTQALSSINLHNFSEEELCDMIKEVRSLQTENAPTDAVHEPKKKQSSALLMERQSIEEEAQDLNTSQMQEMLGDYFKEHKDVTPFLVDPDKTKNIFIKPSKQQSNGPGK